MAESRQHSGVGPTGQQVGTNVRRWRDVRGLTTAQLADEVSGHGVPMTASTVTKVEKHMRRVTVDELVTLAFVLGISPVTLMLPPEAPVGAPSDARGEWLAVTEQDALPWETAWRWMHGEWPPADVSPRELRRFRRENRPYEDQDPAREAYWLLRGRLDGAWRLEMDGDDDGTMVARLTRHQEGTRQSGSER